MYLLLLVVLLQVGVKNSLQRLKLERLRRKVDKQCNNAMQTQNGICCKTAFILLFFLIHCVAKKAQLVTMYSFNMHTYFEFEHKLQKWEVGARASLLEDEDKI